MHTLLGARSKAGFHKCYAGFWASSQVPCSLHAVFMCAVVSWQGPRLSSLSGTAVGSSIGCALAWPRCRASAGG